MQVTSFTFMSSQISSKNYYQTQGDEDHDCNNTAD